MWERFDRIIRFAVIAAIFAVAGSLALCSLDREPSAALRANEVRLVIERLKTLGSRIEEFRRSENRLPTNAEVNCDWKPCPQYGFMLWHVAPEDDGTFTLTCHSPGMMLSPVGPFSTTWHSRDGKTDRDGWDQPWRWQLRYHLIALIDGAVIVFPWAILIILLIRRGRRRQSAPCAQSRLIL